jgi:hypothetical protein
MEEFMYGGADPAMSEPSEWYNHVRATWAKTQDLISDYSGEGREEYMLSFEALRPEVEEWGRSFSALRVSDGQISRSKFGRLRNDLKRESQQIINRLENICGRIDAATFSSPAPDSRKPEANECL